jgi:hypothetical protein
MREDRRIAGSGKHINSGCREETREAGLPMDDTECLRAFESPYVPIIEEGFFCSNALLDSLVRLYTYYDLHRIEIEQS